MQTSSTVHKTAEPETQERIVIHFKDGIYGFETVKDFILLQEDENRVIWSLQAADSPYPSLIVVDPFLVMDGYDPKLTPDDLISLENPKKDDLCFLAVAVIRKKLEDSVVNLKSPVVINVKQRTGRQIVLENCDYPVRYRFFRNSGARG